MEGPFRKDLNESDYLIETFGWWPGEGFRRLNAHLARMAIAARDLGYDFDKAQAQALLEVGGGEALRCRLTLHHEGFGFSTGPMGEVPDVWRLGLASAHLDSDDPWIGYKTSRRELYDAMRLELGEEYDEMILLNERGEVCEGTILNLFVVLEDGRRVTPAIECGLLPGVLRAEAIADGWSEAIVSIEDLEAALEIYVGNSLRGMHKAKLGF